MAQEKKKQEIREFCKQLKLAAVLGNFESFADEESQPIPYLHKLLEAEVHNAQQRTIQRRIRGARFPYPKYLDDLEVDCLPEPLKKRLRLRSGAPARKPRKTQRSRFPHSGQGGQLWQAGYSCCTASPLWSSGLHIPSASHSIAEPERLPLSVVS